MRPDVAAFLAALKQIRFVFATTAWDEAAADLIANHLDAARNGQGGGEPALPEGKARAEVQVASAPPPRAAQQALFLQPIGRTRSMRDLG